MTQSVSRSYVTQLQECIALAREVSKQPQANQAFAALRDKVAQENPDHARLLELLWGEFIAASRSSQFWRQISDVEKELSERMAENHVQLRQNYLRLMQEQ
ncbi:hypothetical protein H6G20_09230 [Desertifilum sp. FACHB-1129]|uniref:Uncharacterized protein n=1 Tax=Desertifilum tharense IPPAS B-1220 TaxID=1781255 RepID=A0A1E5QQ73_9CYAN|nr:MULTISPECIES: hypothetical protein [Desertifilum]MCD8485976.1 hypothetical protein [Desertifilum sp.]MDA0209185.1 hypothetical protein [Cyanobacteria bacterium FC1]MDI9635726.1 hypothetical protein [Geitlerinema splendidum]MDK3157313.1 hypothetical protein [Kamptonema cortianum]MBD2311839.1 hypothetical protein [Desertifilum sp. FACHB-1129]